jgi:ribose-phosphate pyrophosphokinase
MIPLVLALPGSEAIARRLARAFGGKLGTVETRRFPDGESYVRLKAKPAHRPVIVVAALDRPDEKFLPLVFLASVARDLGASEVGLVCPYLPYMRQDKRFHAGEAVTSTYFAGAISRVFDWLVTVDPHLHRRKSLSEIYSIPAVAMHAASLISEWIRDNAPRPILVGPDSESAQWVAAVAKLADAPFTVLTKRRLGDRSVKVSPYHMDDGAKRTPVLVDDIVSTARTMIETIQQIRAQGGARPWCVAVHGLFADDAYNELRRAGAGRIVSSNSIAHRSNGIDVTELLAVGVRELLGRTLLKAYSKTTDSATRKP